MASTDSGYLRANGSGHQCSSLGWLESDCDDLLSSCCIFVLLYDGVKRIVDSGTPMVVLSKRI